MVSEEDLSVKQPENRSGGEKEYLRNGVGSSPRRRKVKKNMEARNSFKSLSA